VISEGSRIQGFEDSSERLKKHKSDGFIRELETQILLAGDLGFIEKGI